MFDHEAGDMNVWDALVRLARLYAWRKYGYEPIGITLHGPSQPGGGPSHYEPLPPRRPDEPRARPPSARADGWASGDQAKQFGDCRAVYWPGLGRFKFSPKQAAVVRALWEARQGGVPEVGQADLLRTADSDCARLVDLFKGHPAWGSLIVRGEVAGHYRLHDPPLALAVGEVG
jgi:hypothetical protein